jgi:hypothetical protein
MEYTRLTFIAVVILCLLLQLPYDKHSAGAAFVSLPQKKIVNRVMAMAGYYTVSIVFMQGSVFQWLCGVERCKSRKLRNVMLPNICTF